MGYKIQAIGPQGFDQYKDRIRALEVEVLPPQWQQGKKGYENIHNPNKKMCVIAEEINGTASLVGVVYGGASTEYANLPWETRDNEFFIESIAVSKKRQNEMISIALGKELSKIAKTKGFEYALAFTQDPDALRRTWKAEIGDEKVENYRRTGLTFYPARIDLKKF